MLKHVNDFSILHFEQLKNPDVGASYVFLQHILHVPLTPYWPFLCLLNIDISFSIVHILHVFAIMI